LRDFGGVEKTLAHSSTFLIDAARTFSQSFHDARHSSLTHQAAADSSPVAIMATAGHASMATTKRYLHLAGVVFKDEADAFERRLLGGSVETSGRK
jgi:integrase